MVTEGALAYINWWSTVPIRNQANRLKTTTTRLLAVHLPNQKRAETADLIVFIKRGFSIQDAWPLPAPHMLREAASGQVRCLFHSLRFLWVDKKTRPTMWALIAVFCQGTQDNQSIDWWEEDYLIYLWQAYSRERVKRMYREAQSHTYQFLRCAMVLSSSMKHSSERFHNVGSLFQQASPWRGSRTY